MLPACEICIQIFHFYLDTNKNWCQWKVHNNQTDVVLLSTLIGIIIIVINKT